jgi:Bacterial PH domain
MAATVSPDAETIRRPARAAGGAAVLLALAVFFAVGVVFGGGGVGPVVLAVLAVLAIVGAYRMAVSGVYVNADGITLRDALRTRHIPWWEVRGISPATDDAAFRTLGILTSDGGRVRCAALTSNRFEDVDGQRFQLMHERLERQLERARAEGRCPRALDA